MDKFWQIADVSRLDGAGDLLRQPRGLFTLGAVVVLVLYGLSVGRTKALVSLLSIYVAYVLTVLFPFRDWLASRVPESAGDGLSLALFLLLYALVFLVFSRSMSKTRLTLGEMSLWQVILISVVQIGLLASIGVSLLPVDWGQQLFGPVQPFVSGTRALWVWAAASLAILPLLRTKRRA